MPSGGFRPGAGRPRKATKHGGQIAAAEQKIADQLPWLVGKALELAAGVKKSVPVLDEVTGDPVRVPVFDEVTGKPKLDTAGEPMTELLTEMVYVQKPCIKSIKFLYERVAGRTPQEVILAAEEGAIQVLEAHREAAALGLDAWRLEMNAKLLSLPSAPPTSPTSATPTE